MASFVHITDARCVAKILRTGLRAERTRSGRRGVFCVPDMQTTFQWVRELKGRGYRTAGAVQFSVPDDERVWVGRYGQEPKAVGAARAVALFMSDADTRGWEVVVARGVHRRDIHKARSVPQMAGWRHFPEAKGQRPFWPIPGSIKAARTRVRIDEWAQG